MTTRISSSLYRAVLAAALLNAVGVLLSVGYAQMTTNITSSGLGTAINGSTSAPCLGGTCTITGGDRRSQNLFHSFGCFDIGAGNTANFSNNSGLTTSNIISRVTGGQTSSVFGTIQTTGFGTANLFLLNPAASCSARRPGSTSAARFTQQPPTTSSSGPMALSSPIRRKEAC